MKRVIWLIGIVFYCVCVFAVIPAKSEDILIDTLLKERVKAHDLSAQAAIKTIITAIESYRAANDGKYPEKEEALLNSNQPYLWQSYNNKNYQGYIFSLEFRPDGYKIIATPEECGKTGNKVFIAISLKDSMPTAEDFKNKTPKELENLMKESLERDPYELTEKDCEKSQ